MAKSFVFLEVADPEINYLVHAIRETADHRPARSNVHITIRGPYSRVVGPDKLRRYEHLLLTAPLVLDGVGSFSVGDRTVVYLKVQHPRLRQLWWKPDFPVSKFGFNPHITMYEGTDHERARLFLEFLKREQLKLLTWNFKVTPYVSDHADLFPKPEAGRQRFLQLVNSRMVRADILARLERALRSATHAA
jgi:2'-5' RNA ligase